MIKRLIYDNIEYSKRTSFSKIKANINEKIPENIEQLFLTGKLGEDSFSPKDFLLKEIEFSEKNKEINSYALIHCAELKKVILPANIVKIKDYAFNCCYSLENINLNYVESIEDYAFAGCTALRKLLLPPNIKYIGESSFAGSGVKILKIEGLQKISDKAFSGCIYLKDAYLPENLEEIGTMAFLNSGIESIILPNNLKIIKPFAFRNTNLKEIILPDNIEYIGELAFGYCKDLEKIIWRGIVYTDKVDFKNILLKEKVAKDLVWF